MTRGDTPEGGVAPNERPRRSGCEATIEQRDPQRRVGSASRASATGLGLLAALLALALASGCGGSSKSAAPGGATAGHGAVAAAGAAAANQAQLRASIAVASPGLLSDRSVAPEYTCKGGNVSIPLKWAGVNSATAKELVVSVRSFATIGQSIYNWTVAGISPSLQQIPAGKLPAGAIVGRNSFGQNGYNLCLVKGATHMLVAIDVWALPRTVNLKPGFDPAAMVEQVRSPTVAWGSAVGFLAGAGSER